MRRSIITVRVRRTGSGVDARRGRGRAATEKATGVNKPAQAEAARAHTHRASLCARETVPKAALHCSLSNRIFFCGLLFSFLVTKSARSNEWPPLLYASTGCAFAGDAEGHAAIPLASSASFSAASCPPLVLPQIFTPTLPWPVQDCRDGTGTCTSGFWLQQITRRPLTIYYLYLPL